MLELLLLSEEEEERWLMLCLLLFPWGVVCNLVADGNDDEIERENCCRSSVFELLVLLLLLMLLLLLLLLVLLLILRLLSLSLLFPCRDDFSAWRAGSSVVGWDGGIEGGRGNCCCSSVLELLLRLL